MPQVHLHRQHRSEQLQYAGNAVGLESVCHAVNLNIPNIFMLGFLNLYFANNTPNRIQLSPK